MTHTVYCKDCGKELAEWNGGWQINVQKHEEWVCQGKIKVDCSKENVFYNPKTKERSRVFTMDGGAGTQLKTPKGEVRLLEETRSCLSTYCRGCAKKRNFKCPTCGGKIKLDRRP